MKNRSRVIMMTAVLLVGLPLWLPTLRSRWVAAQSIGLTGSFGFTAAAPYSGANNSGAVAILGVITFDGAGSLSGSEIVVQPDPNPNAISVQSQKVPFTGTYMVNADGTGTLTVQIPDGPTVP